MSTMEITSVECLTRDTDPLLGCSIDSPLAATSKEDYSFELAGWVLARQSAAAEIELVANDGPVRTVSITQPRPDVVRCYPEAPPNSKVGFCAPISVIGMTPEFELLVQVVLENTLRIPIARIRGRHRAIPSRYEPTIKPLLVTSLARTGTTWIMHVLAQHPSVAVLRIYP